MTEEIEKLRKPQKKPVRYFSDVNKVDPNDVEHIKVDNKKKSIGFKGEVIQVKEKVKYFPRSKWDNKRPAPGSNKFLKQKRNRKFVELKVDPYAKQRHSRK